MPPLVNEDNSTGGLSKATRLVLSGLAVRFNRHGEAPTPDPRVRAGRGCVVIEIAALNWTES